MKTLTRVDTVREDRETDNSARKRNQSSQAADHVVVFFGAEEPEHLPRTNDHEGTQVE